jgi:hypothetical protein
LRVVWTGSETFPNTIKEYLRINEITLTGEDTVEVLSTFDCSDFGITGDFSLTLCERLFKDSGMSFNTYLVASKELFDTQYDRGALINACSPKHALQKYKRSSQGYGRHFSKVLGVVKGQYEHSNYSGILKNKPLDLREKEIL